MSWLSFDDGYTDRLVWDGVPYEARWLHHCILQRCSATRRYDGRLPRTVALRCSDVPDPEQSLKDLVEAGLLVDQGAVVEAVLMAEVLPAEHLRPEHLAPRSAKKQAEYRRRKCERGEHSKDCPPGTCPVKRARDDEERSPGEIPVGRPPGDGVTDSVTGNAGSGRVGSDREERTNSSEELPGDEDELDSAGQCGQPNCCGQSPCIWLAGG